MLLSILDQSPIAEGRTGGEALHQSIALAREADRLGYHRFWMAEHHATPSLASASPELMLAAIGRETRRIRLGTGGIMLPHYSPLKVAESFSMLAGMFPGRIDLGLGRAPGSDPLTAYALQQDRRTRAPNEFPAQLRELMGHFDGDLPGDHPFRTLGQHLPGGTEQPAIWVLGSSPDSAELAAMLGLPYCIADFIAGEVPGLADQYRRRFRPSARLAEPQLMVAVWITCAATEAAAHHRAGPSRMLFQHLLAGQLIPVPHPDTAARWLAANPAPDRPGRRPVIGTPQHCREQLAAKQALYGADELMLVTIQHSHEERMEGYRLLMET